MTSTRRVTPPQGPAVPHQRTPVTSSPWNLAELQAPDTGVAASHPLRLSANGSYSPGDVSALRDQMQEHQVRAVAEARRIAFDEGRAAGRAEAQAAAERRLATIVAAATEAAETIRQHEEVYTGVLEENLAALACAIARQVLQREVESEPEGIRSLVQSALAEFPQETALRVRLNPADHAILHSDPAYRELTWVADPRIIRGGCVVEGRERIVDGRLDIALEQVYRRLTGSDA